MVSIVQTYITSLMGTGFEILVFSFIYGYIFGINMNWWFIVLFICIWALILAPLNYIIKSEAEKQINI